MEEEEAKGEQWRRVNSSMTYLIYCKKFSKCHNVPHSPQQ
jgi:hypothetical protein